MTATAQQETCGGHAGLGEELRALALAALDAAIERAGPVLERLREEPAGSGQPGTCAVCPVCAVLAALRGERPELAARLAEHAAGLLAALRSALEEGAGEGAPAPAEEGPAPAPSPTGRRVQRIPVDRPGGRC